MTGGPAIAHLLRELAPQVLGVLVRRCGDFDAAEDAVQEALLAAVRHWPRQGVPDNPRGWLIQTGSRKLVDQWRGEHARRRRERLAAAREPPAWEATEPTAAEHRDDTLTVLFLCCHPALTAGSAIALTLRALGGLTTAEIATAFLVPVATMGQRISRAKQRIRASGQQFRMPTGAEWRQRLDSVLHVLYLMFNEGYASSGGDRLQRGELSAEAIRLTRTVHRLLPDDGEVASLLALMLLTDARRPARTDTAGELIPLREQDRARWDRALIADGTALLDGAMGKGPVGQYRVQAAIAALHSRAARVQDTDWPQILALYGLLEQLTDNPVVSLNRAVAVAMVHGPREGLRALEGLDRRLPGHHRLDAVRAHLCEEAGDLRAAEEHYPVAAARTTSTPERRYLTPPGGPAPHPAPHRCRETRSRSVPPVNTPDRGVRMEGVTRGGAHGPGREAADRVGARVAGRTGCPAGGGEGGDPRAGRAGCAAPLAQIEEYRGTMGWTLPFVSSHGTSFARDCGVGEGFLLSVFLRDGDEVYRTYTTTSRGVDRMLWVHNILDLTPYGRQEKWEDSPPGWPQPY